MPTQTISHYLDRAIQGHPLTHDELIDLSLCPDKEGLYRAAHQLTHHFGSKQFDSCSIINAKSGNCSEDCKWCAQSAHYPGAIERYPLVDAEEIMRHARHNHAAHIGRFSLVTSGRRPSKGELTTISQYYRQLRSELPTLGRCASLGLLDRNELQTLFDAGVERYHCNLETAPSFFHTLCSTHTTEQKTATLEAARSVGMTLCSGGIIGMGETMEQRIELALTLRALNIDSIPINILQPIAKTPLATQPPLADEEILTTIALFRFALPATPLRFSGGRATLTPTTQAKALWIGINAAIMGDMLTTIGSSVEQDKQLIHQAGYTL